VPLSTVLIEDIADLIQILPRKVDHPIGHVVLVARSDCKPDSSVLVSKRLLWEKDALTETEHFDRRWFLAFSLANARNETTGDAIPARDCVSIAV